MIMVVGSIVRQLTPDRRAQFLQTLYEAVFFLAPVVNGGFAANFKRPNLPIKSYWSQVKHVFSANLNQLP